MIKLNKLFLLMLILSVLFMLYFAIADEASEKTSAYLLEAKKNALDLAITKFISKMDAAIAVAKEKSLDATKLQSIHDDILAQKELINASTIDELKDIRNQVLSSAEDFRKTAKEIGLRAYEDEINESIKTHLDDVKNQTDFYSEQAAESRKIGLLRFYDQHIERVEKIINYSKSKNVSTTLLEQKLEEFKALKSTLVDALNSGNKTTIQNVTKELKDKWKELNQAIITTYKDHRIKLIVGRADLINKVADRNIQRLKSAGFSTGNLEQQLNDFGAKIKEIQEAQNADDSDKAEELTKELNSTFRDLAKSYAEARTGRITKAKEILNETSNKGAGK